jgi:hypothetical protein
MALFPHQCVDTAGTSEMWLAWFSYLLCAGFERGTKNRQCLCRAANPVKKCTTIYKNLLYKFDVHQLTCIQILQFVKEMRTVVVALHLFNQPHVLLSHSQEQLIFSCKWNYFGFVCEVCPPFKHLMRIVVTAYAHLCLRCQLIHATDQQVVIGCSKIACNTVWTFVPLMLPFPLNLSLGIILWPFSWNNIIFRVKIWRRKKETTEMHFYNPVNNVECCSERRRLFPAGD